MVIHQGPRVKTVPSSPASNNHQKGLCYLSREPVLSMTNEALRRLICHAGMRQGSLLADSPYMQSARYS